MLVRKLLWFKNAIVDAEDKDNEDKMEEEGTLAENKQEEVVDPLKNKPVYTVEEIRTLIDL